MKEYKHHFKIYERKGKVNKNYLICTKCDVVIHNKEITPNKIQKHLADITIRLADITIRKTFYLGVIL